MGISDLLSIIRLIIYQKHNYKKKKVLIEDNFYLYLPAIKNYGFLCYFISKIDEDDYNLLNRFFLFNEDKIESFINKNKIKELHGQYKELKKDDSIELKTKFNKEDSQEKGLIKFYTDNKETIIVIPIDNNKKIFGLGSKFAPFDRKGFVFDNYNTDNPYHAYFVDNLYSTINIFYIFDEITLNTDCFILDYPGFVRYDFGKTKKDEIRIKISSTSFGLIKLNAYNFYNCVKIAYGLCENYYKPPFHAFGYTYSHWGIKSKKEIEKICKAHEDEKIPISNICLDIDYMDSFKNFTVNQNFGKIDGIRKLCKKLKEKKIFLIPIIDAGIKIEHQYEVFEEFNNSGVLVKTKDNKKFEGIVWPGKCIFPDFFSQKDQLIFKKLNSQFISNTNFNGCWLDMNEPSIFDQKSRTFPEQVRFYDGKIENYKLHNMYPYFQSKAVMESFLENNIRPMLFSRSFYTFMNQFCGNWTGDNQPKFSHLKTGFEQIISLSLSLVMYAGTDIGGFWFNPSNKLLINWFSACLFHPLYRNHSSIFARPRVILEMKKKIKDKIKKIIMARYLLLPTIYSLFMISIYNRVPYIMPYLYKDNDKHKVCKDIIIISENIGYDPFETGLLEKDSNYSKYLIFEGIKIYIKKGKGIFLSSNSDKIQTENILETFPLKLVGSYDENNNIVANIYIDDGITSSSLDKFAIYEYAIQKSSSEKYIKNIKKIFSNLDRKSEIEYEKLLDEVEINIIQ
ncbi:MAG: TIM-barrel domain-containing protein [Exilispira sp.]